MNTLRQRGFNVIELMVAVAVLAVLFSIGVPSFSAMVRNNRVVANTNELVVAFAVARSEALRRGLPVTVCGAADLTGTTCVATGASNWAKGWIVFTDASGTAGVVDGPTDEVLQSFDAVPVGITLTSNSHGFVRFAATGLPAAGAADTVLTIKHNVCTGNNKRTVKITTTGRLNTTKSACP